MDEVVEQAEAPAETLSTTELDTSTDTPADWRAVLPEDIRSWDEVSNADSSDKFWDQVKNMRSLIGQSIRVPGENAGAEDWAAFREKLKSKHTGLVDAPDPTKPETIEAFYRQLGKPETADEYKLKEGEYDADRLALYKAAAHEAGLTQNQFERVLDKVINAEAENSKVRQQQIGESQSVLKHEWGNAYPDRVEAVKNLLESSGAPKELAAAIEKGGVNGPTLKWLYGLAEGLAPEGRALTQDATPPDRLAPSEARAQIDEMLNNKEHPYWNNTHPSHQAAIQQMLKLQKAVHRD